MPLRALRKALVAFAAFDSVAACRACAAEAGAGDATGNAPDRQSAEMKAAEKLDSENEPHADVGSGAGQ